MVQSRDSDTEYFEINLENNWSKRKYNKDTAHENIFK